MVSGPSEKKKKKIKSNLRQSPFAFDLHQDEITAKSYQETCCHGSCFYLNDIKRKILNKASNKS